MSYIIKATPNTTGQMKDLCTYLTDSQTPYILIPATPTILSIMTTNPILHIDRPQVRFKATQEFKHFLGSENLNKRGEADFDDILERVYTYTKVNKLLSHDQCGFHLDETLNTLLKTYSTKIDWNDLYQHILLLLVRVN
jgi:hypothetical protein